MAKNSGKIFNVEVGGVSIGITTSVKEKDEWLKESKSGMPIKVHEVDYKVDPKYLERPGR